MWIKAGVVENRFEGDRISQSLQEAEVPFMIKSFLDTAYDGLYVPRRDGGSCWFLKALWVKRSASSPR